MRPTEIQPIDDSPGLRLPISDRLTQVLVWVAFFLLAAIAALTVDLVLQPADDRSIARAVEPSPLPPTLTVTVEPTIQFTAAPTTIVFSPTVPLTTPTPATPPPCVPPPDWAIHIVQEGNTLFSLGQRYGTDVETLMSVNCLNTYTIFIGQRLYVPGPPATPTLPPPTASPTVTLPLPAQPVAQTTPMVEPGVVMTPSPTPAGPATPRPALALQIPSDYVNIVLLGSDKRPDSGAWRTDSMIVVSVDSQNNLVRLLSIPRDLWVYIPGHGYNRVNTADLWGELNKRGSGPEWVKQTIHYNLGIPIHYYVRIDFQGFMNIIDAVGGVDVDVECPLPDISLAAGMHHMDGKEALRYTRSRKSTSDFDRGRRQRKVLMALWDQALTLDIIPRIPELWRAMAGAFQTDLTLDQVINLAYLGVRLEPQRILSQAIGPGQVSSWITPEGAAVLLPRPEEIKPLIERFYGPRDANQLDDGNVVRLRVLNGSSRRQAQELAAAALSWGGFKILGTGPADRTDYAQTQIQVYTGNLATAQEIAQTLGVPAAAIQDMPGAMQPNPGEPVDIVVILGQNYNPCR